MNQLKQWFEFPEGAILAIVLFLTIFIIPVFFDNKWNIKAISLNIIILSVALLFGSVPRMPSTVLPQVFTLFLVDVSKSISKSNLKAVEDELRHCIIKQQEYYEKYQAQVAIMIFASEQRIILPWIQLKSLTDLEKIQILSKDDQRDENDKLGYQMTDLAAAIQSAAQYIQINASSIDQKQMVLITDGNDSRHLTEFPKKIYHFLENIQLDIRVVSNENTQLNTNRDKKSFQWIQDIAMPETARIKEPFDVLLSILSDSNEEKEFKIKIKIDGKEKIFDKLGNITTVTHSALPYPFATSIEIPGFGEEITETGYHLYEIELLDENDHILHNRSNVIKFFPSASILIVEDMKKGGKIMSKHLENFLQTLQLEIQSVYTDEFNIKIPETIHYYDLVLFYNLSHHFFTPERLNIIEKYVSKSGGGVLFIGGDNSFDHGDYTKNNKLIELLPVAVNQPIATLKTGKLIFLLDVSASMEEGEKLYILKQSVINTINQIPDTSQCEVAIYTFDRKVSDALFDEIVDANNKGTLVNIIQNLSTSGGTKIQPALDRSIKTGKSYLQKRDNMRTSGTAVDSGVRVYIFSDGEIEEELEKIKDLLNKADLRMQFPTMSIVNKSISLKVISTLGGGTSMFIPDQDHIIHFDPGLDPNKRDSIPILCSENDQILGDLFSGEKCPNVYGFNNLKKKGNARESMLVPLGQGQHANLLTLGSYGRGKIVTLGMDLHAFWSAQWFLEENLTLTIAFMEQLILNSRRSEKSHSTYSVLNLRKRMDGTIDLIFESPLNHKGPFYVLIDNSLEQYSLHLTEHGTYQTNLRLSEKSKKEKIQVVVKMHDGTTVEKSSVWIGDPIIRPENTMNENILLLYNLHDRVRAKSIGMVQSDRIWITEAFLEKMNQTLIQENVKKFLTEATGHFFENIDGIIKAIQIGKPTQQTIDSIKQLYNEAKYTPFSKPNPIIKLQVFYATDTRIPLLIGFIVLFIITMGSRLGKGWIGERIRIARQQNIFKEIFKRNKQ